MSTSARATEPPRSATAQHRDSSNSFIVAPQWIGDAVMTEPLLRRLSMRGERLTVGALPSVVAVYRAMPQVSEVVELPFQRGHVQWRARHTLGRQLAGRFDTAYVLPNSLKSALLPVLAGIPKRVGYLGEARVGLLTHRLRNPGGKKKLPMVAFYSALAGEPGVEQDRPRLHVGDHDIVQTLAQFGLAKEDGYVVLAPGAEFVPAKRWPVAHFAELARRLERPVVLLGSGKEAPLCEQIANSAAQEGRCLNLAGRTTLAQALALIAGAASVVSNDSGLMHVAAAFGVRQVAIFGSSSPLHTPPLNDAASVIWLKDDPDYQRPLDCAPCFARVCPLGHTRCLNDVSAERVLEKI